jgi:hypothetical protein
MQHMTNLKPQGWKDSAQWYTFWAIIVLGGSGIALAFIRVVLQAAQLAGVK